MIESDPVLVAYLNLQALIDNGADEVTVDQAYRVYLKEVEEQMRNKAKEQG